MYLGNTVLQLFCCYYFIIIIKYYKTSLAYNLMLI